MSVGWKYWKLRMMSTETDKENEKKKNYSAMVAATRDWVYYLKLHEAGRLWGLASHTDANGDIAPCCAATRASLSASAVCMRSCTGLAGVLAFFSQNVRWGALVAVRTQRMCVFGKQDSDTLVRPGPRMAQGAMRVAQCLQRLYPGPA